MAREGTDDLTRAPTPTFLKPTRDSLVQILTTLHEREMLRRSLGQQGRSWAAAAPRTRSSRSTPEPGRAADTEWYSVAVGTAPANVNKNRYGDIIAYDRTRVLTATAEADPAAGPPPPYVNASLVREPELGVDEAVLPRKWWIAAQAPIASTVHDFLSLLLTRPCSPACAIRLPPVNLVVQLTPLVEGRRAKCHPYFPDRVGETAAVPSPGDGTTPALWVRLEKKEERDGARESILRVGREGEQEGRRVVHLEYLGWRDHGVPESAPHLLRFIHRVQAANAESVRADSDAQVPEPPILLHCSAGVGRTGTFIAISSLLPLLAMRARGDIPTHATDNAASSSSHPLGPYPADALLQSEPGLEPRPAAAGSSSTSSAVRADARDFVGATIDGLRDQRTTMAQTSEQVAWVYECLREAWRSRLYGSNA
ncbi:hypothetical protein JCM3774_001173 [Rhodotorula dairenensis]